MDHLERLRVDAQLNPSEERVLKLTASGLSAKEIASMYHLSTATVNTEIQTLKVKLNAQKNTELSLIYFSRKYKIPITSIITCAILLLSLRPYANDMRRCRTRVRIEEEYRRPSRNNRDDATY